MIPTVNFWPNPTQDILNSPVWVQQPQSAIPKNKFLDGVRKMQEAEWLDSASALTKSLEYFKSQGKTIEGIDIDSQLSKYQTKAKELQAEQEDTWFFEALGDVLKKRWDKGAEILTAWVNRSQGQGKLESGVQYAANLLWGLAEITGTAFVEWLDAVTPEAIQDKFKAWVAELAETQWGEFVVGKLQEVSDNMETLRELNPRAARNFEALGNSVDAALTFYGGKTAKEWLQAGTQGAKTVWKEAIEQIGKQADVLWDTAKTVGTAIKEVPWQAATRTFRDIYKLNQNTIEQAFKNPEVFTKAQKVWADDYIRETADKVVDAVKVRADELSELGKEYATIRKWAVIADDIEVGDILTKNLALVPEKQLTKADRTVINDAKWYLEWYTGKLTDEDVLSLRKQLDSLKFDPNTWLQKKLSPQGNRVVTALRNDVDKIAKDRIKGLKELDAKFAPEIAEVNKLKSVIFDSRGELKDRYIADISNLMWKGKELKIERIRKIIPDIDEKLNMYKALVDLDNVAEWFKVGAYAGGAGLPVSGAIGAILWWPAGAVIGAVIYQMISNPKLGIEIVKKLSIAKDMKDSIIKSIKEWVKLKSEQAKALVVWVRDEINVNSENIEDSVSGLWKIDNVIKE